MLLTSCTGLRKVSPGMHLYTGQTIKFDTTKTLYKPNAVKNDLIEIVPVKPNRKFLWMRPGLCLHNLIPEPKQEKGFWYWMKYKLGEAPAYLEDMDPAYVAQAFDNNLQNRGHFSSGTIFEVDSGRKTAKLLFKIFPGKPYTLKSINYPQEQNGILGEISRLQNHSILKPGKVYNLKDFENERFRIDSILKEKGYYYFHSDYLLFTADTMSTPLQVAVRLKLKPEMPALAAKKFTLNDIYVLDDYSISDYNPDTMKFGQYYFLAEKHQFNPVTISNAIFLEKDSLYSRNDHYNTIRHLMGIGIYKFAIVKFMPEDSINGKMNASILLTPFKKISLSAEVNAAIKSTGFTGPGLKLSYKDKNIFGSAELFTLTLAGNFETQLKGDSKGQTSFQVSLNASLTLPKFVPFKFIKKDEKSIFPKTIISAGIGVYSRVQLYDLQSFNVSLGYNWRKGEKISHSLRVIDLSYTNLLNSTADFEEYLQENPTVRKSFEEQFIIGGSYGIVYSNFNIKNRKHIYYLAESIDFSGNLTTLIANISNSSSMSESGPYKLLGVPYSQFARLRNEFRYFYNFSKTSQIGIRLIAGLGIPYTNSTTMPYNRQYFSGGPSSIRSFFSRSIGPGTYVVPDSLSTVSIDQAGDIILESSLEYRFDIIKSFKGALFTDAGNIWLVNDDPQRSGGKFNKNTFYSELAVGSGFGLRFDFTFIILRLDVAFPLRKPWLPESERWVIDKISFGNSQWRRENLIWNIAIGYPF